MTLAFVFGFLPALLRRHLALLCAALLIPLLGACAELPRNVQRPVSTALETVVGTPLAALVDERRAAATTLSSRRSALASAWMA